MASVLSDAGTAAPRRAASGAGGESLALLWRRLGERIAFPVSFRSPLDGAPFWAAAVFLSLYAIAPTVSSLDFYAKYLFAGALITCCIFLAFVRQVLCLSPAFPVGSLALGVTGILALGHAMVRGGGNTYSSALIPLMVVAAPLFVPLGNSRTGAGRIMRYQLLIFGTGAAFHVLWQLVGFRLGISEPLEDKPSAFGFAPPYVASAGVILYFMVLAGLFRRPVLFGLALGLTAASLVLRPSSTLAFCGTYAIAAILLHRLGFERVFRTASCMLAVGIILANLAILSSDAVTRAIYSVEPYVKSDVLQSKSNNDFRIGIIAAARAEMLESSIWIGHGFGGGTDVSVSRYLPWLDGVEAPIHSDFLIITVQGGLLGLGLFASLFVGLAALCRRGARLARAAHDRNAELLFDATLAIGVVFMLYISFNPMMQLLGCALPFLMVVPMAIFLVRDLRGFSG